MSETAQQINQQENFPNNNIQQINNTTTEQKEEEPSSSNYKLTKTNISNVSFPTEINWPKALKDYEYSKKNLE